MGSIPIGSTMWRRWGSPGAAARRQSAVSSLTVDTLRFVEIRIREERNALIAECLHTEVCGQQRRSESFAVAIGEAKALRGTGAIEPWEQAQREAP